MSYKFTNITDKTFKKGIPVKIFFDSGYDHVEYIIEPNESIILEFIPKSAHQLYIRNVITYEFVKPGNDIKNYETKNIKKIVKDKGIKGTVIGEDPIEDEIIKEEVKEKKSKKKGDINLDADIIPPDER